MYFKSNKMSWHFSLIHINLGKKKKRFDGLKLENAQLELPEETALDAEFLDVYKGTNGVIMVLDLTKTWTFDYVQRELPKIPGSLISSKVKVGK